MAPPRLGEQVEVTRYYENVQCHRNQQRNGGRKPLFTAYFEQS